MRRLAQNHRILYVVPPVDLLFYVRHPEFKHRAGWLAQDCPKQFHRNP